MYVGFLILFILAGVSGGAWASVDLDLCQKLLAAISHEEKLAPKERERLRKDRLLDLGYKILKPSRYIIAAHKDPRHYTEAVIQRYEHEDSIIEVMTTELRTDGPPQRMINRLRNDGFTIPNRSSIRDNQAFERLVSKKVLLRLKQLMAEEAFTGLEKYMKSVDDHVRFAMEMDLERSHFNGKFLQQMPRWGQIFAMQARNVSVYEKKSNGRVGERTATIRSIRAPYTTVRVPPSIFGGKGVEGEPIEIVKRGGPAHDRAFHYGPGEQRAQGGQGEPILQGEDYFSKPGRRIRFERPSVYEGNSKEGRGEIIEPSIWAVKEGDGYVQTLTHLMTFAIDPLESFEYNMRGKMFYTFADKPLLYVSKGFKPVSYYKETKDGWVKTDERIKKDGLEWQLLGIDTKGLLSLMVNLRDKAPHYTVEQAKQTREFLGDMLGRTIRMGQRGR